MKFSISPIIFIIALFVFQNTQAQEDIKKEKFTSHNKGKFFFFWGGNRESFSKSDITFKGENYDFTLNNVAADDKPKGWHIDYVNPSRMTIPQTNFRMGYFISDKYNISIGVDHMKYVLRQNVAADFTGYYPNQGTFGETLPDNQVLLTEDFLTFEHTDGLNYIHTEFSRMDDFSNVLKIKNTDKIQINLTEGIGAGIMLPKTNTKLIGKERHDNFHISGFGVSAKVGINITFFKYFFIQSELKAGFINMNNIRTTNNVNDKAQQNILFLQRIIAFGGIFKI